jgi:hypothetical protein
MKQLSLLFFLLTATCWAGTRVDTLRGAGQVEDTYVTGFNGYPYTSYELSADPPYTNYGARSTLVASFKEVINGDTITDTSYFMMKFDLDTIAPLTPIVLAQVTVIVPTWAGKHSGTLNIYALDSSWHEGAGVGSWQNGYMGEGASRYYRDQPPYPVPNVTPPDSFDWSLVGSLNDSTSGCTPLKAQDNATCYVYAAYGAMESAYKIFVSGNDDFIFKERQYIGCGYDIEGNPACYAGGNIDKVFKYILEQSETDSGGLAMQWISPWYVESCGVSDYCLDDDIPLPYHRIKLHWWYPVRTSTLLQIEQAIYYCPISTLSQTAVHEYVWVGYHGTDSLKFRNSSGGGLYGWYDTPTDAIGDAMCLADFTVAPPHKWNPFVDHGTTLLGSITVTGAGTYTTTLDLTTIQGMVDGTIPNNGFVFIPQDTLVFSVASTQSTYGLDTNCTGPFGGPPCTITYTDNRPHMTITTLDNQNGLTIGTSKHIGKSINIGRPQ